MGRKKNILVVDDSALMRRLISDIINSDERFQVSDLAMNGLEAFDLVTRERGRYDAILLDINMPRMNGIEFLEQLEKLKIRQKVIIVSTVAKEGAKETVRCLELGAFDFVTKPDSFMEARNNTFRSMLLASLKAATGVDFGLPAAPARQAAARPKAESITSAASKALYGATSAPVKRAPHRQVPAGSKKLVALACSTGGPKALQSVIPLLPAELDAPFVLVQHMAERTEQNHGERGRGGGCSPEGDGLYCQGRESDARREAGRRISDRFERGRTGQGRAEAVRRHPLRIADGAGL